MSWIIRLLVPAALVVDHEQRRDVGEHIVERTGVVRVGRQPRLGLQHDAHRADRRQAAIADGYRQLDVIIHPGDYPSKNVRFEAGCVEQIYWNSRLGLSASLKICNGR